ncbi:hypothetical protein RND81_01G148000 [Saponaria officinalis]|uniref:Uncharacterized protein n=1 Tax=Saponaria officinalis TaxID=3572 RepID=A0AAW1NA19_SAPOF
MVAILFNLVYYTINTITNVITKVIFSTTAYFFVVMFQAFKVPGEATKGILERVAEFIRWTLEYTFEVIIDVISTLIVTIIEKIKDGIVEIIVSGSSATGNIIDQTKSSLEGLIKDVSEIIQGFAEMIFTLVYDLWNNYFEAIDYVKENA